MFADINIKFNDFASKKNIGFLSSAILKVVNTTELFISSKETLIMIVNKVLLSSFLMFLFSGALFATSCPSVGGYTVSSHNANNTRCVYKSYATVKLDLVGQRVRHPNCPRFILTDPGFRLVSCAHNILLSKCVCTIVSH